MKKISLIAGMILALAVLITGCQSPLSVTSTPKEGKVTVSFADVQRTLVPGISLDVHHYDLVLSSTQVALPAVVEEIALGAVIEKTLQAADYTVVISAVNENDVVLGEGSANFTVVGGANTPVQVNITPIVGNGTVTLNADLTGLGLAAPVVSGTLSPVGGSNTLVLSFTNANLAATATRSDVPNGYYVLTVVLKDGDAEVSRGIETVFVVAGAITEGGVSYHKQNGLFTTSIAMGPAQNVIENLEAPSVTVTPPGGVIAQTQQVTVVIDAKGLPVLSQTWKLDEGVSQDIVGGTFIIDVSSWTEGEQKSLTVSVSTEGGTTQAGPYQFTKQSQTYTVPDTLGALYTPQATTFRIWSPDHTDVKVVMDGQTHSLVKRTNFNGYTDVYEVVVAGDHKLKEYQFKVNSVNVRDPYGSMVKNGAAVNVVMDMSSPATQPTGGWAARPSLVNREDSILYEVHARDFTIHESSGVTLAKRGKFAGMVEAGTTLPGNPAVKTGIDHLVEMGITHVQILPFYDFATLHYNWGYDPKNFNVPEEQYSINPDDHEYRVKELRDMINEFHKRGIRVVMDVVYNHSYGKEQFQDITTKYYTATDLSGTGNSTNTGIPMVSRMIQDSLEFWISEYGIDGFRFDLIGVFHYNEVKKWGESINAKFPDRNILLYGEPWNGYATDSEEAQKVRMGTTPSLASARVGVFNGQYREAIKGNNDGVVKGYMFNTGVGQWWGAIPAGMRGSLKAVNNTNNLTNMWDSMFAVDPEQTINYISAHDNFALWDKTFLSLSSNVTQNSSHQVTSLTAPADLTYAKRVVKFGAGMVVASQGLPFIHAGDEFLRTKTNNENMNDSGSWNYGQYGGTHNTYNAPDSFNAIRWTRKVSNADVYNYHKDLIALRLANPGMRLTTWDEIKNRVKTELNAGANDAGGINTVHNASLPGNAFVSYIDQDNNVGNGYELVVVFNAGNNFTVSLPAGTWKKIFDIAGAVDKTDAVSEGTAITVFKKQ